MAISSVFNEDCMIGMARMPDKSIDLAIVDPPYGIGEDGGSNHSRGTKNAPATKFTIKNWDTPPIEEYFKGLFRVSKNQIIFGANHFISKMPIDSSCWIVWDKVNFADFADCELAWTSFKSAVRQFTFKWQGMLQGDMKNKEERIHPTQKPVALYKWLLSKYATPGQSILDTHMGSQSSRIAAYKLGFDYYGWELDEEYFRKGCERFDFMARQRDIFLEDPDFYTTNPD
jgi:site-specific DNA-methyltransferase (adenine-specific)